MGHIRNVTRGLALIIALALLLAAQATAAESDGVWLCASADADGVTANICADTAVASGVITLTYDRNALTFREITVDDTCVAAHAVNAKAPGKVQISWIAPAGHSAGDCQVLLQIHFDGEAADSLSLSGSANGLDGEVLAVTTLDFAPLNAALAEAEGKKETDYTADSFQALLTAREEALALLQQALISPAQLASVTENMTAALAQLETPEPPAEPTEPGLLGGSGWIAIAVAAVAVCAAGAVTAVVILKKRGKK